MLDISFSAIILLIKYLAAFLIASLIFMLLWNALIKKFKKGWVVNYGQALLFLLIVLIVSIVIVLGYQIARTVFFDEDSEPNQLTPKITKWELSNGSIVEFHQIPVKPGKNLPALPDPPPVGKIFIYKKGASGSTWMPNDPQPGFLKIELRYVPNTYIYIVEIPESEEEENKILCCLDLTDNSFYETAQIRSGEKPENLEIDSGIVVEPIVEPENQ